MSERIQDRAWGLAGGESKPPNKVKRSARYRTVHPGVRREVPFLKLTTKYMTVLSISPFLVYLFRQQA